MTGYTRSPRLLRCGLVLIDPNSAQVLRVIAMQYNPDSLSRSLQIKGAGAESGDQIEALRLKGPPVETIKIEAEIDASDALESADVAATQNGLHPVLAALETIVYPSSAHLIAANAEASSGTLEIAPAQAPLVLFVFGTQRVLPVRITELSFTEEAFDVALNPIRAKVSFGLRVLSVDDLGFDSKGGGLFMSYLQAKERLAQTARASTLSTLGLTGLPG